MLRSLFCCLIIQVSIGLQTIVAQPMIYSQTNLGWVEKGESEVKTNSLLVFNKATRDFSAEIAFGPLLKNRILKDSLENADGLLKILIHITIEERIESFGASENKKTIKPMARVTIGDSTKFMYLPLVFNSLGDKANSSEPAYDATTIPARVNFVLVVDPIEFGLNRKPIFWTKRFIAEVENGFVNKK